jgi:DNA sulfur modification protein DndB
MNLGFYSFLAIRGHQGKHEYYLIQCPLRLVPRLFVFDEAEVPTHLRRARSLDASRVAGLVEYLATQPDDYVLAPLVATIDGTVDFDSLTMEQPEIGRLQISLAAQLIIHDGQHRRAAIRQLLAKTSTLSNDSVPVMLFSDPQLVRSPRIYADLNQAYVQRSRSQRVLHDQRDLATLVRQFVDEIPLFQNLTELEKTTISNRSTALFTLSAVYQATQALLEVGANETVSFDNVAIAQQFWQEIGEIIPEWQQVIRREVTPSFLREHYVHSHTVTLLAIAMAGHELITTHPHDWSERLHRLGKVDWSRDNLALWEGRAMVRGRMSKARDSVNLTTIALKRALGLEITEKEQDLERRLLRLQQM